MSQYSYMQDNAGTLYAQYPTPDSTQPLTNNSPSQPRTPGTLQSSQSNTIQLADSFLSDVPQGAYSECSTLDNSSVIPVITQESSDITPHTPESILYSPGDERTDLNLRKQSTLRRSPRISSNQIPQTFEQQSDSTSLESQDGSNNRELINESNDLLLSEQEKNTSNSRDLDNSRVEQEFSTSLIDTENRDINELRDLITTSNIILDSVHHSSVSYKNHEVDNEMEDIEYTQPTGTIKQPHEVSRSELEREHENENEYPESVDFVLSNEISDTLLRQSEHYNNMASKISNLKFIRVEPESEEEIEQFTSPITPGVRRSTRKRTTASYNYPRYSYGGSRRSKTRKRRRSPRKRTLSVTENEADVDSEVVNVDNEKNKETDELVHNLLVQSDEEQEAHGIHDVGDGENINENIFDNDSQNNLYLKHDLRSRKIMLELPGVVENNEEIEKEPVSTYSKKITRSKHPAKKTNLKNTSKKSAKTIPKRRISRRSISRKKNEDREWHPDEADNELGDDSETVMAKSKTRLSSKAPKKSKKVESIGAISEVSTKRRLPNKKAPKILKTPKITRKERKPARGNRGRGKGRSGITRGSRSKDNDTTYKYSCGEETESEVEITSEVVDDNSDVRELSDAEIEQNITVVEESVSTPTRPKRIRKSTNIYTSKSSRSTRSRDANKRDKKVANTKVDDDVISNIHEQLDEETADVMEAQVDLTPSTQPKKTPSNTRGRGRGGKVKGRSARIGGNTATDQPIVPNPVPSIVEVSSGNQTTLANAVRALKENNFDVVQTPGTPPPESGWSNDHWHNLKKIYRETKSEYLRSDKVVIGNEDIYREVNKKFYDFDTNNRTFGEQDLRNRVRSLEVIDSEKSSEPSGGIQRRNSIESSSSRSSKSSVSRYNKAYSNLLNGSKRKRSESNATTNSEGNKVENNKEEEIEDKVSKRHRVEGNTSSGSGTTPPSQNMNTSQTSPNNGILSKLFRWF